MALLAPGTYVCKDEDDDSTETYIINSDGISFTYCERTADGKVRFEGTGTVTAVEGEKQVNFNIDRGAGKRGLDVTEYLKPDGSKTIHTWTVMDAWTWTPA